MNRLWSLFGLALTIVALLGLMVFLRNFDFGETLTTVGDPKSIAATGFIILAAFSMGEFFKQLRIPALLGYIAAGIIFGPNLAPLLPGAPEALFDKQVILDLTLINVLTVGVIGTMGGGELKIADIKDNLGTIALTVLAIFLLAAPLTFGVVVLLAKYATWMVPFLDGQSIENVYAVAALFAVFAVAMSPAATLAIFQETKATGKFTSLVLGIVVVADLVLVAMFLLTFQLAKILISPEGFTTEALQAALPAIAAEFGWALVIGLVCGLVFIIYLRFIKKERLFFTVAIIFATSYIAQLVHAEVLLAFLTAGFIVQNFSKHGHDMIHALEKISLPVFVIYFMTQAAQLDLKAVAGFLALTAVLTVVRSAALYFGARIATTATKKDSTTKRHLWLAFFSRGGVDLVLAAMVGAGIPTWGPDFQTAIMAIVVVHIVAGPPLLNKALDWAGQTEGSRARERADIVTFATAPTESDIEHVDFEIPDFEDEALNEKLGGLGAYLSRLRDEFVIAPIERQSKLLSESLSAIEEALDVSTEELHTGLKNHALSLEAKKLLVRRAKISYLSQIRPSVDGWENLDLVAVTSESLAKICDGIRGREAFDSSTRVARESFLFDAVPGDSIVRRVLKVGRKARAVLMGRGARTIPVGRLWRYYVELTVTRYLAGAVDASAALNEPFWSALGTHFRRVQQMFDAVEEKIGSGDPLDHWDEEVSAVQQRGVALEEMLQEWSRVSQERFGASLREPYQKFLVGVRRAGTVELPSFAYRASALFDRSRRAEGEMRSRVLEETKFVKGHRGWVVMEFQLVHFVYWQDEYEIETRVWLRDRLTEPVLDAIVALRERCEVVPTALGGTTEDARERYQETSDVEDDEIVETGSEPDIDWESWLENELRPILLRTRRAVQRSLAGVNKGISRERLEVLEDRIDNLSERIELLSEHPDEVDDASTPILVLPMREWFKSEVARETALRFVEFNERAEALFRRTMATIESIQQVIEFNLITANQDRQEGRLTRANDLATGGLARSERLAGDLHDSIAVQFEDLMTWMFSELDALQEAASRPLFEHEIATIETRIEKRTAARLSRGSWMTAAWESTKDLSHKAYKRYEPTINDVLDDVQFLLLDEDYAIENADIRERLHPYEQAGQSQVPAIYRRLFTPNPLDISDFYVPRKTIEARICSAVRDWDSGRPNTILVHGDRGIGKRSMMRHLTEGPLRDFESRITRVIVDETAISEQGIATSISSQFTESHARNFKRLRRLIRSLQTKPIIMIENGEKLYTRTKDGMALCRSFLRMIDDTADRALWIVLMGTPAATLLQTAIELSDYFTHSVFLEEFDSEEIREMIERRHRVSGFQATFDRSRPRFYEWVVSPIESSEIVRDPESAFFDRLGEISHGNPLLALEYWLESIEVTEEDEQLIRVHQLPDFEPSLLKVLSLRKRLILAALVQHNALAASQLNGILGWGEEPILTEIDHLERLGFIETRALRDQQSFQVRDVAEGVVTKELREMNMI